jgi:D-alanyl-D-alanine carboxypeptidase
VPISRSLVLEVAEWADGWLAERRQSLGIPGLQFAVAHDGEVVRSGAHGVADLATGELLTDAHRFRVASHSKAFTATAVTMLAEAGRLALDDKVAAHVPWVAGAAGDLAELTVRDCLHHGGGVGRDGADGDYWQLVDPFPDVERLRALVSGGPNPFPQNDRFHYSNLAYAMVGLVVEAVTGERYADHLRGAVLEPLGLAATSPDLTGADGPLAAGHSHDAGGRRRIPIDSAPTFALAPATGFVSTAKDLVTFFGAHRLGDRRLLGDAAKRRMQRPRWTTRDGEHYGLGLQILDIGARRLVGHSGGFPGQRSKTWCDPKNGVVVSVLANSIDGPAPDLCTGIFRLLDHVAKPRPEEVPGHAGGTDLVRFGGRFVDLWGAYDLASFGDRLLVVPLASNDPVEGLAELAVESDTVALFARARDGYSSEGERFAFERDADGRIVTVRGSSSITGYPPDEYDRRFLAGGRLAPPG